jgi:hypothetical protein
MVLSLVLQMTTEHKVGLFFVIWDAPRTTGLSYIISSGFEPVDLDWYFLILRLAKMELW